MKFNNKITLAIAIYIHNYGKKVIILRISLKSDGEFAYSSYGVNCTEVEVDVLTGEVEVVRSDILFDCGQR